MTPQSPSSSTHVDGYKVRYPHTSHTLTHHTPSHHTHPHTLHTPSHITHITHLTHPHPHTPHTSHTLTHYTHHTPHTPSPSHTSHITHPHPHTHTLTHRTHPHTSHPHTSHTLTHHTPSHITHLTHPHPHTSHTLHTHHTHITHTLTHPHTSHTLTDMGVQLFLDTVRVLTPTHIVRIVLCKRINILEDLPLLTPAFLNSGSGLFRTSDIEVSSKNTHYVYSRLRPIRVQLPLVTKMMMMSSCMPPVTRRCLFVKIPGQCVYIQRTSLLTFELQPL